MFQTKKVAQSSGIMQFLIANVEFLSSENNELRKSRNDTKLMRHDAKAQDVTLAA